MRSFTIVAEGQPETPDRVRDLLERRNREFADANRRWPVPQHSKDVHSGLRALGCGLTEGSVPAKTTFAAALGCADARVSPEIVFRTRLNEIFVVRVAGNVLGQDCLGSLRYAVSHSKLSNLWLSLLMRIAVRLLSCRYLSAAKQVYGGRNRLLFSMH